jgi:hypothetical protein
MIVAGEKSDLRWGAGSWIILDIGFANDKRTCGVAFDDEPPTNLTYGEAWEAIINQIRKQNCLVNLVIEAPLSVCFDAHGNPKGRKIEKQDAKTRYRYNGLGCAVMTAAMYVIRDIHEAIKGSPMIEVRLFEGFVTFKGSDTDHKKDVLDLREKVKNSGQYRDSIYGSGELKICETDLLCRAFSFAGLDCGVPAAIVVA